MNVVVLGATGLVGDALVRHAPSGVRLHALTRADADIRDADRLGAIIAGARPSWVLNAAAYTNVDGAEREPSLAFETNAHAVATLAELCRKSDCALLHFSTDYVFDGAHGGLYREIDHASPLSVYGASKLAGEEAVRRSGARHVIVRTSWVYGARGRNFLSTLVARARARQPTRVVEDQFSCTTWVDHLAAACWDIVPTGCHDATYHVANRGRLSRLQFARPIFEAFGAADVLSGCLAADTDDAARRPRNSALDVAAVERLLQRPLSPWREALSAYVRAVSDIELG